MRILEAIGDRKRFRLLEKIYYKGSVDYDEVDEAAVEALLDAGLIQLIQSFEEGGLRRRFYRITSLGRHVYLMTLLLSSPLDVVLESFLMKIQEEDKEE